MFTFFTELNRKRPPAQLLDFVHNLTCPIVHAADDRSVMETHEALPYQVTTARSFIGTRRIASARARSAAAPIRTARPSTPNPHDERFCLVAQRPAPARPVRRGMDAGLCGEPSRPTGVEAVSLGAPTGPMGIVHRRGEAPVPYYDDLGSRAVYPAYHVVAGLARAAGAALVEATSTDDARVRCLAYRGEGATLLWLANLTAQTRPCACGMAGARRSGSSSTRKASSAPPGPGRLRGERAAAVRPALLLRPYAVALACIVDA
jgi:hypothetical protein